MNAKCRSFHDDFFIILQKACCFTPRELRALWAIITTIIDSRSFSLSLVSRTFGRKIGRNFLATVLKKYAYVQRRVAKLLFRAIYGQLSNRAKISLILDDTLAHKCGQQIFGALRWYDHTLSRRVQAICLVNLAVVLDNHVVFVLPWVVRSAKKAGHAPVSKAKEQDPKTTAAIALLEEVFAWLEEGPIPRQRIVVLADAWFGSHRMLSFLRAAGVIFRIDGKKNYSVQLPDHDALAKAKIQKRGRKRKRWVTYRPLAQFLGAPAQWHYFTDTSSGTAVFWKSALVTLKTGGRVRISAFRAEGRVRTKFIMTNPCWKTPPTPQTVYRDYSWRWRIEEAHRDLKQHFGLGNCHNRDAWVVLGFFGLLYLAYSLFKQRAFIQEKTTGRPLTCPSWAEMFHRVQIYHKMSALAT